MINEIYNMNCIEGMKHYPDNYFDLAIVDPPYGIGFSDYERGAMGVKVKERYTKNGKKQWDAQIPSDEYFLELFRVSKNQIIWGGNYFVQHLNTSMGWIFWDKKNGDSDFSDGELAYTSFNKGLRKFEWLWAGFQKQKPEDRIHPTQKPVALYEWLLSKYAKPNDKIIDTHGGSGSIAIAVDKANTLDNTNYSLDICELDKDYFDASLNRFNKYKSQQTIQFQQHEHNRRTTPNQTHN